MAMQISLVELNATLFEQNLIVNNIHVFFENFPASDLIISISQTGFSFVGLTG